jgi:hypothetical protein
MEAASSLHVLAAPKLVFLRLGGGGGEKDFLHISLAIAVLFSIFFMGM